MSSQPAPPESQKWYEGISRYQWLVLLIASLGWVFDVFEGQIFVATLNDAMPALTGQPAGSPEVRSWNSLGFASFLLGGAFGGVLFGVVSDRTSADGVPLIVHNIGRGPEVDDLLFAYPITGHYRYARR